MLHIQHEAIEQIIREVAAAEILPRFRNLKEGDVSFKVGDDPVTIADKAAEKQLAERLTALIPGSKVVGEEAYAADPSVMNHFTGPDPVWIVDPIDGTRNFVLGNPAFGVIIALAVQNQTIASWLYHPGSDEFVTAELGAGAFYKGEKLKVLPPVDLQDMIGVLGYRLHKTYKNSGLLEDTTRPKPHFAAPAKSGCHDFPRLVLGRPHFGCDDGTQWHFRSLLQTCSPWDDAAPLMIHAEAGGYSAHWNGTPFTPSSYGYGFMAAPTKESWEELINWISTFCKLP